LKRLTPGTKETSFRPANETACLGEDAAAEYLSGKGYRILERNWRCRLGEIDIICADGPQLIIVEVKSRRDSVAARRFLFDTVGAAKQRKLCCLAECFLRQVRVSSAFSSVRIDVVGVILDPRSPAVREIRHLQAAVQQ
jgi:putative endonuclease